MRVSILTLLFWELINSKNNIFFGKKNKHLLCVVLETLFRFLKLPLNEGHDCLLLKKS